MGAKHIDMTGQTYNSLRVIKLLGSKGDGVKKERIYLCKCVCGNFKEIIGKNLRNGRTKTCGCTRNLENHGLAKSPTYFSWIAMRQRCNNPYATGYKNYGGRGIKVNPAWDKSFSSFLADMGVRPKGKSLDRIDNSKNYEPNNCCWSTPKQQANNRRNNKRVPNN